VKQPRSIPLEFVKLRLLVGFLGERRQSNWWDCTFLDATGRRFLETTFPRTALLAGLRSTTEAAQLLHDSRIGRVGVFHLFRLPIEKEDVLEAHIQEFPNDDALGWISSGHTALDELRRLDQSHVAAPHGPVQISSENKIFTADSISEMAAHYYSSFAGGFQCFPYFTRESDGRT
jgi:hypothetical protein